MNSIKNPGGNRGGTQKQKFSNDYSKNKLEINQPFPHEPDAEIGLLHACLSDPTATDRAREFVHSGDFYDGGGRAVFEMVCKFRDQGRDYNPQLIIKAFEGEEFFDRIEKLIDSIGPFFTGQTSSHFGKIILEQSLRRRLIRTFHKIHTDCFRQDISVDEILGELQSEIDAIRGRICHD